MEKNITILIADDEKPARDRLKSILNNLGYAVSEEAENGDEVIKKIVSSKPNLVFLDINMPGLNVFDSIKSLKEPPLIIFQTAYSQYAVDAFGINAIDYLLKPYSIERVKTAIEKALKFLEIQNIDLSRSQNEENIYLKYLSVKDGNTIKLISIDEIIRICFEEGFSFIYTNETRFLTDKSLNDFENILEPLIFFRTSRTDIIKLSEISAIHPMFNGQYTIEMKDRSKISLSRRRAKELRVVLNF
ncbi:MAG TPA: LytTR family DNA-binding domain-containing protein [Spirochaetota bacterium]|nr:LytTR family DNA-binding domain-containing protein [Spirochaetota bacterium]